MSEQEDIERSERYIATNRRLLAAIREDKERHMKEFIRKENTLIQEIYDEEKNLKRKRTAWPV